MLKVDHANANIVLNTLKAKTDMVNVNGTREEICDILQCLYFVLMFLQCAFGVFLSYLLHVWFCVSECY